VITDDDLRVIFQPLHSKGNVKLTFIADCCHRWGWNGAGVKSNMAAALVNSSHYFQVIGGAASGIKQYRMHRAAPEICCCLQLHTLGRDLPDAMLRWCTVCICDVTMPPQWRSCAGWLICCSSAQLCVYVQPVMQWYSAGSQ
jgi:hypothetical protein